MRNTVVGGSSVDLDDPVLESGQVQADVHQLGERPRRREMDLYDSSQDVIRISQPLEGRCDEPWNDGQQLAEASDDHVDELLFRGRYR